MRNVSGDNILQAALCMTRQCWEQGMLSYSLLRSIAPIETDLWDVCLPADKYWQMLKMLAYDMVLRQSEDGRLCNVEDTPAVTDSAFCIPAVLAVGKVLKNRADADMIPMDTVHQATKKTAVFEEYIKAAHKNAGYLLRDAPRTRDGILYHMRGTTQIWADSASFLPYGLVITGYPEEGYRQMAGILDRLYLEKSGLYAHIWDEASSSYPDGRAWSVGVAWILTGLERTWRVLPEAMERERMDLKERFLRLMKAVLSYQCEDGGFHDVMDDPATYMETETPAMVACAIYAGIRDGLLPGKAEGSLDGPMPAADGGMQDSLLHYRLLARADAMSAYVEKKTLPDGRVIDAASSPSFDRPGTSVECQAHVWMLRFLRHL